MAANLMAKTHSSFRQEEWVSKFQVHRGGSQPLSRIVHTKVLSIPSSYRLSQDLLL